MKGDKYEGGKRRNAINCEKPGGRERKKSRKKVSITVDDEE